MKSKDNSKQTLHAKFYASGVKTSALGGEGKIRPPPPFWHVFKSPVKTGLRLLTLEAMLCNFAVRASHVPGRTNSVADALFRNQVEEFFRLAPRACRQSTEIPAEVFRSLMA